jgi:hypothetical protein
VIGTRPAGPAGPASADGARPKTVSAAAAAVGSIVLAALIRAIGVSFAPGNGRQLPAEGRLARPG